MRTIVRGMSGTASRRAEPRGSRPRLGILASPISTIAVLTVAVAIVFGEFAGSAVAAAPVPCTSIGGGKYDYQFYPAGDGISGGTPVLNSAGTRVGYLNEKTNWIVCQQVGRTERSRAYYNKWWAYTQANNQQWGWASAVYAKGGENDGPFGGGVPNCNGSKGNPPVGAASSPTPAPSGGIVHYVAMGDSYASGVSLGHYGSSGDCKRSSHAYAYRLATWYVRVHPDLVACSGATTTEVARNQLSALSHSTDPVTISVGGDDLHFSKLIKTCIFNGGGCSAKVNHVAKTADATLKPKLAALYAKVRGHVRADTKVEVIGYPRLFPTRTHQESFGCRDIILAGIEASEQDAANHLADVLNKVIGSAARAAGFGYINSIPDLPQSRSMRPAQPLRQRGHRAPPLAPHPGRAHGMGRRDRGGGPVTRPAPSISADWRDAPIRRALCGWSWSAWLVMSFSTHISFDGRLDANTPY